MICEFGSVPCSALHGAACAVCQVGGDSPVALENDQLDEVELCEKQELLNPLHV